MTRDEILEVTRRSMARTFDIDPATITEATTADDVEAWDSVSHLVLLTSLEKRFNTALPMERVNEAQNVGALIDVIEQTLAEPAR
jgi:acyl carrier protein